MLSKLNVAHRLSIGFGTLVALMVTLTAISFWCMAGMRASTQEVNVNWLPSIETLAHMNTVKSDIRTTEWRHVASISQADKDWAEKQIAIKRSEFEQLRETYVKLISSDNERRLYEEFDASWKKYLAVQDVVLEHSRRNDMGVARQLMAGESRQLFERSEALLAKDIDLNDKGAAGEVRRSDELYDAARLTLLVGTIASVALAVGMGLLVTRSILKQLGGEPAVANQIATAIADGDLSRAIAVSADDRASLLSRLATMQHSLRQLVAKVRSNAESVATASAQIAQGSQDLSGRTEAQASALQQTTATMDQLGTTVRQSAENTRHASHLAENAAVLASEGGIAVGKVVSTMHGISIGSREVAQIIGVIEDIAFQTNILALNASVEAANAREHGRGFAVVASEVRSLAQRSADAARRIKMLIGSSVEQVEQGARLVDDAAKRMAEIVSSIRHISQIMAEIAVASAEQSTSVQQVGHAVSQMDEATQQNAALVEESAAAAASLRIQAQQLVETVAIFRLGDAAPTA